MNSNLPVHPKSQEQIEHYLNAPGHALLLTGSSGIGKRSTASAIAASLITTEPAKLSHNPYVRIVKNDGGKALTIEQVRELNEFLSLKVPGNAPINRVIIVEKGETMTPEAQNAFLKTLEEPPHGTVIIMTADSAQSLLPTVRSRLQAITMVVPARLDTISFFKAAGYRLQDIEQAYGMSGGLPSLMAALLNDSEHPLKLAALKARELLGGTPVERLVLSDTLAKQRQLADDVLYMLQQMAHISLQTASGKAATRWQNILSTAYEAQEALLKNGQPKLVLTQVALQI